MKYSFSFRKLLGIFLALAVLATSLGLAAPASAQPTCGSTYVVQRGDYLTKIARACGVSYTELLKANPGITNPSRIFPGQVLNIPSSTIPVTGGTPTAYTVQAGDTLFSIGQRYGLSVAELQAANPGVGSAISAGQVLNIPARIRFAAGATSAVIDGQLGANSRHVYLLRAEANQTLDINITGSTGLTLAVRGADGSVLKSAGGPAFRGVLPRTQDYVLELASGASATGYRLSVAVPVRIRFASGGTSATVTGSVTASSGQYYILRALQGQTLTVAVNPQAGLTMAVYGMDGAVLLNDTAAPPSFSAVLPGTQDYIVALKSTGHTQSFTLTVTIPADGGIPVTGDKTYTVQRGDTLNSIARRFGTTVTVLLRANPHITNANRIDVGQVIYLPGATLTLSNGQVVYVADRGDTLSSIARKFNRTLSQVTAANPQITNPNLIYTGQRINIP